MRVYVVSVIDRETKGTSLSQEAYLSIEKAIEFISTRAEQVRVVSPWLYATDNTLYKITDLMVA